MADGEVLRVDFTQGGSKPRSRCKMARIKDGKWRRYDAGERKRLGRCKSERWLL